MTHTIGRSALLVLLSLLVAACSSTGSLVAQRLDALLPADAILLGEQHDAAAHQQLQLAFVDTLAQRGQLAALVLEMAERGTDTLALARDATAQQVQASLRWNVAGWPWERYAPMVMAAVAQGVPVLGANLPRVDMRAAMSDTRLDNHLAALALERQREAIRVGHCDLLPAERLMPMLRIQLARDASMASVLQAAVVPGKTVLLVAGAGHVVRDLGIPTHLPPTLRIRTIVAVAGAIPPGTSNAADLVWPTPALPPQDHCAELRRQFTKP